MKKLMVIVLLAAMCWPAMYGKTPSEQSIQALEQELDNMSIMSAPMEEVHTYPADSLARAYALYEQLFDNYRSVYRPSDSVYLSKVFKLAWLKCYAKRWRTDAERYDANYLDVEDCAPLYLHFAGLLWTDLLKWDEVKVEEYQKICAGEYYPFRSSWFDDDEGWWDYTGAIGYFGFLEPESALAVARAHATLQKRFYSANSEEYEKAADRYVEVLQGACRFDSLGLTTPEYMEEAMKVCEEMLKTKRAINDQKIYDKWKLAYYQALLSARKPSKSELRKIEKYAKTVTILNRDTTLRMEYVALRAECAILRGDYEAAITYQSEELKRHLPMPDRETDEYYKSLNIFIPLYSGLARTYVLSGDVETAVKYVEIQMEMIYGTYQSWEKEEYARDISNYCFFPLWQLIPYRRQLQMQLNARLKEWCECDWEEW